jgi:hypothetical protein
LLSDGVYDFTVVHAEEKISQSGNEYIFLKLGIWDDQGRERLIFTNLALIKLLKHFCDISGLQDKYQLGEVLALDCLHKMGKVEIGIEKGKPKLEGGMYPDKNIVKDYIKTTKLEIEPVKFIDDSLPF